MVGYETLSIRLIGVRFNQLPLANRSVTTILAILPNRAHSDSNVPLNSPIHVVSYQYHHKASEHRLQYEQAIRALVAMPLVRLYAVTNQS